MIGAASWVLGYSMPHEPAHFLTHHIKEEAEEKLCVGWGKRWRDSRPLGSGLISPSITLCDLGLIPSCFCAQFFTCNLLAGMAQWIECQPTNQKVTGSIPSRAHASVAGQAPNKGRMRGNCTLMFLSLSFSLPSPL